MLLLNNKGDDRWKEHFGDSRAKRVYSRKVCDEPETEAAVSIKVPKEECTEPMVNDEAKTGNPA